MTAMNTTSFYNFLNTNNTKNNKTNNGDNHMIESNVEQNQLINSITPTNSEPEGGFPLGVPDGSYTVKVVEAKHWQHTTGKYDVVKVDLEIQDGPEKGHMLNKYFNQNSKDAVKFFRREMSTLGVSVKSRSEIQQACKELVGIPAVATVMFMANGNQVIFLKGVAQPKKAQEVDPDALWS
jgi:hypothetical protein